MSWWGLLEVMGLQLSASSYMKRQAVGVVLVFSSAALGLGGIGREDGRMSFRSLTFGVMLVSDI